MNPTGGRKENGTPREDVEGGQKRDEKFFKRHSKADHRRKLPGNVLLGTRFGPDLIELRQIFRFKIKLRFRMIRSKTA